MKQVLWSLTLLTALYFIRFARDMKMISRWLVGDLPKLVAIDYPLGTLALMRLDREYARRVLGWKVEETLLSHNETSYRFVTKKGTIIFPEEHALRLTRSILVLGRIFS